MPRENLSSSRAAGKPPVNSARALESLEWLNLLTGAVLCFVAIFGPWALGCEGRQARNILVDAGILLSFLLAGKWLIRHRLGHGNSPFSPAGLDQPARARKIAQTIGFLTALILAYGLISFLNAPSSPTLPPSIAFVPAALSSEPAGQAFWLTFSMAAVFWSARDWLLGGDLSGERTVVRRQKTILWIITLNALVLALVCIAQRINGTELLLWTYSSPIPTRNYTWGPFYYRANGAQYFNLVWPVILSFLWLRWRHGRLPLPMLILLVLPAIIAPTLTGSRGGMLFSFAALGAMALILWLNSNTRNFRMLATLAIAGCVIAAGAIFLGGRTVAARWRNLSATASLDSFSGRVQQNRHSWTLFTGRPWFGAGPGCYETAYREAHLPNPFHPAGPRRADSAGYDFWHYMAHNDWLQMLVEWGAIGALPIVLALVLALAFPWLSATGHPVFTGGLLIGLATMMIHGAFDYPAQIPGILATFVLLLAALISQPTRREHPDGDPHPSTPARRSR